MFTGLVFSLGTVQSFTMRGSDCAITILPAQSFNGFVKGESIAVNGACLTVEHFSSRTFTAFASRETLAVTNLQNLAKGSVVNLERALALGDRLGGHMVSGHVDALAVIETIEQTGASKKVTVKFPKQFAPQVITKGSVTLDGISLTINDCDDCHLTVNIIPETQQNTTVHLWKTGQSVNFETDIIGKYVQKVTGYYQQPDAGSSSSPQASAPSTITVDFLRKHGF